MSFETLTYLTKLVCTEKYSLDRQKCQIYLQFMAQAVAGTPLVAYPACACCKYYQRTWHSQDATKSPSKTATYK
jgi:hypothetical protein